MNLHDGMMVVDFSALVGVAVVVGGFIVALARQVSSLTSDVASLCLALATERAERQAAVELEASRREKSVGRVHERLDMLLADSRS